MVVVVGLLASGLAGVACSRDRCGNGVVEPGEECDDGNALGWDGCARCKRTSCGDGVLDDGEECDDGSAANWDGCTGCRIGEIRITATPLHRLSGVPDIAAHTDGSFVVVWFARDQESQEAKVLFQRFGADGLPRGDEVQVNGQLTSPGGVPLVAMDVDGSFVVVWLDSESPPTLASPPALVASRYTANGLPKGGEILVSDENVGVLGYGVAMGSDRRFLVSWVHRPRGQEQQLQGRWYDETGTAAPGPITFVDHAETVYQPSVALQPEGRVVAIWSNLFGQGAPLTGQRFEPNGTPLTPVFTIGPEGEVWAANPLLSTGPTGEFLVTYQLPDSLNQLRIFGQRFSPDATGLEPMWTLPLDADDAQDAVFSANGTSLLIWRVFLESGDDLTQSLWGRRFTADGQASGEDFQLNLSFADDPMPSDFLYQAAAAMTPDGRFVVVWRAGDHLYFQRFSEAGVPVGLSSW